MLRPVRPLTAVPGCCCPWRAIGPLLLLALYPLPIGVATLRKHNAVLDIAITNLWLGWTIIGWVFALIWACDCLLYTSPSPRD